ncbi:MAG: Gfo/Idh/MocA family oxidoreductase [Armatimonadetes bacterium]|nr:Gfo/Idh/MocA family oxidoreductase [Armatimonadota bacterium]
MKNKATEDSSSPSSREFSRREFLKVSAASAAAAALMSSGKFAMGAAAGGSDIIKVGLIGCGGRGTGAAGDCMSGSEGVQIVAMGDLFRDRLDASLSNLQNVVAEQSKNNPAFAQKLAVTPERCFTGFDAYKKVLDSGVDMVILATPPGFRPIHIRAAVDAGKHIFAEKPVAVDAKGIRSVMESGRIAKQKGLGFVAGTQRRHQNGYIETMKRIHDGALGEIVAAQCYWNQGGLWLHDRQPEWSDTEYQIRNWLYYTWLSGDHIVEQHVHNIDVVNWALQAHPVKAFGSGGRQVRTDPKYGHIFDHFDIQFQYPGGQWVHSMSRQIDGCVNNVSEFVAGSKGVSDPNGWIQSGKKRWEYKGPGNNPYVQEHTDLVKSIRAGQPLNEAQSVAESVLTAIMGRMAAYTGQEVTWEQALNSKEDLMPANLDFGPLPVPPVAIPGRTRLI